MVVTVGIRKTMISPQEAMPRGKWEPLTWKIEENKATIEKALIGVATEGKKDGLKRVGTLHPLREEQEV